MREYYGFALIAGISVKDARRMKPGFIMDMYKLRADYDARVNGIKTVKRQVLGG